MTNKKTSSGVNMTHLRHWPTAIALAATVAFAGALPAMAQKVLTVAQPGETGLDNLDPRVHISTNHQFAQIAIFDPLVRSHGSEFEPAAAESWEVSPDGMTYTFHLREANWSDGKPVVASDFVSAFQRLFVSSGFSQIYDIIENGAAVREATKSPEELGVSAPDDHTLVIKLNGPAPYFLGLASSALAAPSRADLVEKNGDTYGADAGTFATNGPFLLDSWEHENEIVLKKNPDYWNADAIKLDEVRILVLPDTDTQRNMFDNGELDLYGVAMPLTDEELKTYGDEGKLQTYNRGGYRGITFNNFGQNDPAKAKILSNPNFRKAISYALDRQTFVDKVMGGNGMPATVQTPPGHTIYPGKTWGEVTPNTGKYHPLSADLAKSKEYMDKVLVETGFASVADLPEFDLLTSEDPQNPKMVTPYVLSVLTQQIGLKVKLKQVTGPDFWNVARARPWLRHGDHRLGPRLRRPLHLHGLLGVVVEGHGRDVQQRRVRCAADQGQCRDRPRQARRDPGRGRGAVRRHRSLGALHPLQGHRRGAALGEGFPLLGLRRQRQLRLRRRREVIAPSTKLSRRPRAAGRPKTSQCSHTSSAAS